MIKEAPRELVIASIKLEPTSWVKGDVPNNLDLGGTSKSFPQEDLLKNTVVLARFVNAAKPDLPETLPRLNTINTFKGSERFYSRVRRGDRRPRHNCSKCRISYRLSEGHRCRS